MVTTGAITNRIDRLEQRGLVERTTTDDRRKVIVRLTPTGLALVEEVVIAHLETERELLDALRPRQQQELARSLRALLLHLGDRPAGEV
jgi:DNA-binding MarR family transcriptional regulator